jgi:hypothetical protein
MGKGNIPGGTNDATAGFHPRKKVGTPIAAPESPASKAVSHVYAAFRVLTLKYEGAGTGRLVRPAQLAKNEERSIDDRVQGTME